METKLIQGSDGNCMDKKRRRSGEKSQSECAKNTATDLFLSTVVHEIRNPLAVIRAAVDIIENHGDSLKSTEKGNYIQSIKTAILRVTRIVDSALMLVKVRSNRVLFRPSRVNIVEFCRDVANEIESFNEGRQVIVQVSRPFPGNFNIDTTLLYHVVFNLLSNAVKYSDRSEPVTLELSYADENLIIAVKDNGIGIPRKEIKSIFELFNRGSNVGNRKGIGIGMFTVRHCIAMHGGSISVYSKENAGTTFRVTIPLEQTN
jgi:signal transduction histidine kinase